MKPRLSPRRLPRADKDALHRNGVSRSRYFRELGVSICSRLADELVSLGWDPLQPFRPDRETRHKVRDLVEWFTCEEEDFQKGCWPDFFEAQMALDFILACAPNPRDRQAVEFIRGLRARSRSKRVRVRSVGAYDGPMRGGRAL